MLQRREFAAGLAGAGLLAAARARAQAATVTELTAVADATLFGEQTGGTLYDNVADGQGGNIWTSVLAAGVVRRALLRFDLSSIPPGAQLLEARVEAFMIRLREAQNLQLHRLTASWGEGPANGGDAGIGAPAGTGDSTWSHRFWPSQSWATRGGDFVASASASTLVSGWPAPVVWASTPGLVADVQGWVDLPASNHGWIMIGAEADLQNATRLASRQNSSASARPRLIVRWTPPTVADAEVPIPGWALGLLGAGLAAAMLRRRR